MATLNYNPNAVAESFGDTDAIPAGWYSVTVESEELKTAKSGNGDYLQLTLTVTGPTHAGRKLWWRFNLWNSNPTASEIAQKEIASLLAILNMPATSDSAQLVGAPFEAKVAVRSSPEYGDQNDIKGCRADTGRFSPKQTTTQAPWATK